MDLLNTDFDLKFLHDESILHLSFFLSFLLLTLIYAPNLYTAVKQLTLLCLT